jgi:hypothetical protein
LSRLSPPVQLGLAVALPLLSLIIFLVLVVPEYRAWRRDQAQLENIRSDVNTKRDLIRRAEARGPIPPVLAGSPLARRSRSTSGEVC